MPALKNAKHEAVLQAFLSDKKRVGWRAYKKVYAKSSQRAAETSFSELLRKPEFAARLAELDGAITAAVAATVKKSAQDVFDELAKIGFANTADYFNPDDTFVGMAKLTRDQAAAISGIEIEPQILRIGRGKARKVRVVNKVKFKLHDKRGALVDLGKHFGLFTPKGPDDPNKGAGDERAMTDLEAARRVAFLLAQAAQPQKPSKKES